jgi:hypothetical protein
MIGLSGWMGSRPWWKRQYQGNPPSIVRTVAAGGMRNDGVCIAFSAVRGLPSGCVPGRGGAVWHAPGDKPGPVSRSL